MFPTSVHKYVFMYLWIGLYLFENENYYMPKIITLAHQKGGVGKSTLAVNLAYSFKENVSVCIVDTDPQGTIRQLSNMMGIDVMDYTGDLRSLDYDVVFVDTPPYMIDSLPKIIEESDLVIIPTKAGVADLMAIRATINLVKHIIISNPTVKAAVVFNMVKHGTTLTSEVREQVEQFGIPILKSYLTDRVNFTRSIALSKGVYGIGDTKAEKEMEQLTKEVLLLMSKS